MKYKQSYYVFREFYNGEMILYNTKTGTVGVVKPDEVSDYKKVLDKPNDNQNNIEIVSKLFDQGFLVEENINELEQIKMWHEKALNFSNHIKITMLPNENCNFSCPYCFLYSRRNLVMKQQTFDAVYKYVENYCKSNNEVIYLYLDWYGGEPLLSINEIIKFMNCLNKLKKEYSLVVTSNITTNGYLLSYENFMKLLLVGISGFQVTLDGPSEIHNKLRYLKDGTPTYETIYNNLLKIAKCTKSQDLSYQFSIRVNFLKDKQETLDKFVDKLIDDFGIYKNFKLYFRPVCYFKTDRDDIDIIMNRICSSDEGIEIQNLLEFKVMSKRYNVDEKIISNPLPMPIFSWCSAERYNSFIIGADGSLFFCDTMANENQAAGYIDTNGKLVINKEIKIWKGSIFNELETMKDCFTCKFLPVCLGGCRRNRLENGKPTCFYSENQIRQSMRNYVLVKQ